LRTAAAAAAAALVIWLTIVVGCHSDLRIPVYMGTVISLHDHLEIRK
jgi:hypothetical protein